MSGTHAVTTQARGLLTDDLKGNCRNTNCIVAFKSGEVVFKIVMYETSGLSIDAASQSCWSTQNYSLHGWDILYFTKMFSERRLSLCSCITWFHLKIGSFWQHYESNSFISERNLKFWVWKRWEGGFVPYTSACIFAIFRAKYCKKHNHVPKLRPGRRHFAHIPALFDIYKIQTTKLNTNYVHTITKNLQYHAQCDSQSAPKTAVQPRMQTYSKQWYMITPTIYKLIPSTKIPTHRCHTVRC